MKKYFVFGLILGSIIALKAQGTGTPNNLLVKTDANNYLMVAGVSQTTPISQPTIFSNTRLRTDANGYLEVVLASGGASFATICGSTSNTQVLFNDGGSCGGASGLTYDKLTFTLSSVGLGSFVNTLDNIDITHGDSAIYAHTTGGTNINPVGVYSDAIITSWDGSSVAIGVEAFANANYAGTTGGHISGLESQAIVSAGYVAYAAGIHILSGNVVDNMTGANYGILINDQSTAAPQNYAIKTGIGIVDFGDSIRVADGKALQTDTTTAHTALFQAYDVDGAAYKTFATLTNANTPSFAIAPPSGGSVTISSTSYTAPGMAGGGKLPVCVDNTGLFYAGTNVAGVLACP